MLHVSPASLTLLLADGDGALSSEVLAVSLESFDQHQRLCKESLDTFGQKVAAKGWRIKGDTPSDGNCCFWALSDQLDMTAGTNMTHAELRKNTVSYLLEMPEVCFT